MNTGSRLQLSPIVFGSMAYATGRPKAHQIRIIHCAIDHGITSIDTAPLYDAGQTEKIIGEAIADRRNRVQILTKCGLRWDDVYGESMFTMNVNGEKRTVRKDSRSQSIIRGIDQSLRRLRIETIDLIQIHQWDSGTPLGETIEALNSAKQAGKVREIGISNFPIAQTEEVLDLLGGALFSIQDNFSMLDRRYSDAVRKFACDAGLAFLAYSPLAQGVLAGTYMQGRHLPQDGRAASHYLKAANLQQISGVLERYARPLAQSHSTSIAAVSLAWALAQPGVTGVVAGASSERQCIENATAANLELPAAKLQQLGDAMAACRIRREGLSKRIVRRVAQMGRRTAKRLTGP